MSEATIELPRLQLSYYLLIAIGLSAGGFLAWFFLRRIPVASMILSKTWIYGAVYTVSTVCVKGFYYPTYELAYDLCRILLVSLPIYIAALTVYDICKREPIARKKPS